MNKRLVGLIGANIQRSLSPALHEDAFAVAGMLGYYHLIDLDRIGNRTDLAGLLAAVRLIGFAGVNVTHPCKEAVVPLLDAVAPDAAAIGAVNTVVIDAGGRCIGHNTDRIGFANSFEAGLGRDAVAGRPVLLIGAGGAGRAVAHALLDLGAAELLIHDQDRGRAERLADALNTADRRAGIAASDPAAAAQDVAGVVNATPVGMTGHPGLPFPAEGLHPGLWVADVVYTPLETQLIAAARRAGCRVLTGGGMCVHQAAAAFRLFTGIAPDIGRMRELFDRLCAARDAAMVG